MWTIRDQHDQAVRSIVTVAMMEIGPAVDKDTFKAHLALDNDGAVMKDGRLSHYFEHQDIMFELADLWTHDSTLHTVTAITEIWDESRKGDLGPAPVADS